MYWSDAMWLVDRALYHKDELYPSWGTDVFNDDVDGFNLSYGGLVASDETGPGILPDQTRLPSAVSQA